LRISQGSECNNSVKVR